MDVKQVEQSLIKKFRKPIWSKFIKAINTYELVNENDKIAVCISGGKDSFLMAKCFQELQKHGKIHFQLVFLVMNPGYQTEHLALLQKNLSDLDIPAVFFEKPIFEVSEHLAGTEKPCYMCAKMRRGSLYAKAQELGCNKIALGHHLDDVVETVLMNLIFTGQYGGMMPKLKSDHFSSMELIRPLYFIKEASIIQWRDYHGLTFLNCACKVAEKQESMRVAVKSLVEQMKTLYPDADLSILRSLSNVNLDTVIAYKKEKQLYHFLDYYETK